ncbi:hypothetical protein ABTN43_19610, partial [Acinetobacter baumannii]
MQVTRLRAQSRCWRIASDVAASAAVSNRAAALRRQGRKPRRHPGTTRTDLGGLSTAAARQATTARRIQRSER